jgi:hypothetical protein
MINRYKLLNKYYRKTAMLNNCPFKKDFLIGSKDCCLCEYNLGQFINFDINKVRCSYIKTTKIIAGKLSD